MKQRQPLIDAYNKACNQYAQRKQEAAKRWASEKKIKIARSHSRKSFKKDWMERLEKQGFQYDELKPTNPCDRLPKMIASTKPDSPELNYTVSPENYIPGSIDEIEDALLWAKSITGKIPDYSELSDEFVCCDLEDALRDIDLERTKKEVLAIFQQVVNKDLVNPQEIYDQLTQYQIDYDNAIGMGSYIDRWHNYGHKDFGKWHEINLSYTGYNLIEFQSTLDESITFHVPYDRRSELKLDIDYDSLPTAESEENYGREISIQEQLDYPLVDLLQILGLSPEDFPYKLQNYHRVNYRYRAYRCWDDDDDWMTDDDEDDWMRDDY